MQSVSEIKQQDLLFEEEIGSDKDTFVRVEEKFFLPERNCDFALEVLEKTLEPCYPIVGTKFTKIESVYFDSSSLDIFRSHFYSRDSRFKIRTRKYAPNGMWPTGLRELEPAHVELKVKENNICKKSRFQVGPSESTLLMQGSTIAPTFDLQIRNPDLKFKTLMKRVDRVNSKLLNFQLKPQSIITYDRKAYEKNGLRITIDQNIQTKILGEVAEDVKNSIFLDSHLWTLSQQMRERHKQEKYFVLEVKHSGQIPLWVNELINYTQSQKVSFSKYIFSLSDHLYREKLNHAC
ncbi:MAG: VTC domain-containing protein [Deltaproteobacteria bacterium]|nr:VTC domain-containing protein [Deltaproteobacteria bacterium]